MPKTLLAVDDSATMRKVMEITFGGEDFNVLTADGRDAALTKLGEGPTVVLIDAALESDGYALAKDVRKRLPAAVLVMLSSRYTPYDQAKGKDAGADDFMDKPFDTQQMIDKVKKLLATKEAAGPVAASPQPAPVAPAPPPPAPAPPMAAAMPRLSAQQSPPAPPVAAAPPPPAAPKPGFAPGPLPSRSATLMFPLGAPEAPAPAAPAPPAGPAKAPPAPPPAAPIHAAPPAPPPAAHAPPVPAHVHAAPVVSTAVNGHLAGKLSELGLTSQQADAVLALSREVVERVVWEVVPQLAETMIKEEIARLTKEG